MFEAGESVSFLTICDMLETHIFVIMVKQLTKLLA